eukprot:364664-Chlamydomonas_euryale.AAC.10
MPSGCRTPARLPHDPPKPPPPGAPAPFFGTPGSQASMHGPPAGRRRPACLPATSPRTKTK